METQRSEPFSDVDGGSVLRLIGIILGINVLGAVPAILGGPDSSWFASLEKPALYPPTWAFGVIWTLLFTLMGIAVFRIVRRGFDRRPVRLALGAFGLQMVFNMAWTPVFFGLQMPLTALGVIVVLDVLIPVTIYAFGRVDRTAAALLVPYLLWSLFATLLNYQFYTMNL